MKGKRILVLLAVLLLVSVISAKAEEKFGVKVYDGAKYDAAISKNVSETISINAACYRTNDSVAKVTEFYKKQPGMKYMGGEKVSSGFSNGHVNVTIQNPWMNMINGKMMTDTLITIVKQE
ncbi:MAG: hypothetical protein OHK006_11890 [Thermodesulfovibrionales bacterium]